MVRSRGSGHRDILIDGFVPPTTSVAPMFPFYENSLEWDEFGEVINPDDYVVQDEDMDQAAMHVSSFSVYNICILGCFICDIHLWRVLIC